MARDVFLELLLTTVTRPHRDCLYRSATQARKHYVRFASSKNTYQESPSRATSPQRPTGPRVPGAPKVPLHVGLDRNPENVSAISRIPIPQGVKGENFTPSVLARPLGLPYAPRPGQNSPIDHRSAGERKEELQSYEKVQEKRQIMFRSFLRPYFQDQKRLDATHKGKSFVSNPRLFRRDKALYFPNIWGATLSTEGDGPDGGRDSTPLMMGKVTLVSIFGPRWPAEEQVESFVGSKANPLLEGLVGSSGGHAQRLDVNIQGDIGREWMVKLFQYRIRASIPEERWKRYFMIKLPRDVRRGLTEDVRDAMGLLNPLVGYIYLVDADCRIRWAASGYAWEGEIENLNNALKRLIQEAAEK